METNRIKPIFGVYFIGQRHFDKLETLVSYYMFYSELVKGEKLMYPIEPDVVRRPDSVYVSVRAATDEAVVTDGACQMMALVDGEPRNVLPVDRVGLLFRVWHECGDEGQWLWAQSYETHDYGLLPAECVKRVVKFLLLVFFESSSVRATESSALKNKNKNKTNQTRDSNFLGIFIFLF